MINIIFITTLILLVWFKTDAFVVYSTLLRLRNHFLIKEWEKFKINEDCTVGYLQYLVLKYPDNFWFKLISCPICAGIWLSFIFSLLCGISLFPGICLASLFLYYLLDRIMR